MITTIYSFLHSHVHYDFNWYSFRLVLFVFLAFSPSLLSLSFVFFFFIATVYTVGLLLIVCAFLSLSFVLYLDRMAFHRILCRTESVRRPYVHNHQ